MAFIDLFIKSEDENSGQTHTVVSTLTESVGSPRNLNIGNQASSIESVSEVRQTNVESHTSTNTITADEAIINKVWDKILLTLFTFLKRGKVLVLGLVELVVKR